MNNKTNRFRIFLVIYILLFLSAAAAGLYFFSNYLKEYELSRPKYVLDAFLNDLHSGKMEKENFPALQQVNRSVQSEEESMEFIQNLLSDAVLTKSGSESSDSKMVYNIKSGGTLIGKAEMTPSAETKHGFPIWKITSSEYYMEQFLTSSEIVVPAEYEVYVNNSVLSPDNIIETGIPYEIFSYFYPIYPQLPTLVRYSSGSVFGDISFSVKDKSGKPVSDKDLNEVSFLKNCYPASKEDELKEFTDEYITKYADYTSNAGGYPTMLYSQLKELVVPDSDLHNRIRLAFDAMNYIICSKCTVSDENLNLICEPAEGLYFSDVSYSTTVKGQDGEKTGDSNIRMMIVDYGQDHYKLRAESMTTY